MCILGIPVSICVKVEEYPSTKKSIDGWEESRENKPADLRYPHVVLPRPSDILDPSTVPCS